MTDEEPEIANETYADETLIDEEFVEKFPDLESVSLNDVQINIAKSDNSKNILIVEDDKYIANEYGFMLTAYGFNVSYAYDSEQAVKAIYLYGGCFDFIVLDIRMHYGKYLTSYDTVGGRRTGAILSQEMREYSAGSLIIALTNSHEAFDEAWFEANDRHRFCKKNEFTPEIFAKYVHALSIELNSSKDIDDVESWKDQLSKLLKRLNPKSNITIQFIEEQTMGDKYEASQVGAQGKHAHAHDMVFNQIWEQNKGELDLSKLSTQLAELREAMATRASAQQDYIDIGNIASAEIEVTNGNGPKALEYLKKTGKWTLDIAEKIGVGIAVAAIKASLGI